MVHVNYYIMHFIFLFLILFFFILSHREGWTKLQDTIQARSRKLGGAYEIHKFNRDAKEIFGRVKVTRSDLAES